MAETERVERPSLALAPDPRVARRSRDPSPAPSSLLGLGRDSGAIFRSTHHDASAGGQSYRSAAFMGQAPEPLAPPEQKHLSPRKERGGVATLVTGSAGRSVHAPVSGFQVSTAPSASPSSFPASDGQHVAGGEHHQSQVGARDLERAGGSALPGQRIPDLGRAGHGSGEVPAGEEDPAAPWSTRALSLGVSERRRWRYTRGSRSSCQTSRSPSPTISVKSIPGADGPTG
jgi:hypothetical protein